MSSADLVRAADLLGTTPAAGGTSTLTKECLLSLNLPEGVINVADGNPEWSVGDLTLAVDWGEVYVHGKDGTAHPVSPEEAWQAGIAYLAAAVYAAQENASQNTTEEP